MRRSSLLSAHRKLEKLYAPVGFEPGGNPLNQLIATILSQNTTDKNSERAYASLRKRFPKWEQVADASLPSISASIRQGGLANSKSRSIRNALRTIREREGRISLARLEKMSDDEVMEYLTSMPGVGVKTAACVLLFSMGRPVMPVDTHVFRVTSRLGWLPKGTKPEEAGAILKRNLPDEMVLSMHIYLVRHGRALCKAQRPRCDQCPLAGQGRYAHQAG